MTTNAYLSFLAIGVALVLIDGQIIYRSGRRYLENSYGDPAAGALDDPAGHGAVPPRDTGRAGARLDHRHGRQRPARCGRAARACCC